LTTRILRKIKQIGFLLSLLMTQNTIADSQTNGLNMEMTQSQGDSALFLVKAYGLMKMEEVIGDLS
jgi:alpha-D-ribose 1-methylphosphonate 5-triphosphate synthase subunit PhnI